MQFVNPFDLFDLEASEVPSSDEIRTAKRKALLDFDLADGNAVESNGQAIQRSDFLRATEELSDNQKREFYFALHRQAPALNRFLSNGDAESFLDFTRSHQNKGLYKFPAFVEFVSSHFARQYDQLLKSALREEDLSLLRRLTDHDPLVLEEDTPALYKEARQHIRHLKEEVEQIKEQVKEERISSQRIEARVRNRVDVDLLNALPARLEGKRSQLATVLRSLSIAVFNRLHDPKVALELAEVAVALKTSASTARRLKKSRDEIKEIYEERRLAEKHSDVLEACADAIGELSDLCDRAEGPSTDPTSLQQQAMAAINVSSLNGLPEAFEDVRDQTAFSLRNLATALWNEHQSARAAVALMELALRIETSSSMRSKLHEDLETLEDLADQVEQAESEQLAELNKFASDLRSKIESTEGFFSNRKMNWFAVSEAISNVFTPRCIRFIEEASNSEVKTDIRKNVSYVVRKMRAHGLGGAVGEHLVSFIDTSAQEHAADRPPQKSRRAERKKSEKNRQSSSGCSTSSQQRTANQQKNEESETGLLVVISSCFLILFVLIISRLGASEADTQRSTTAAPEPKPIALADTMHFEVTAAGGPVRELRVTADDTARRPYWIDKGNSRSFAATDRIVFGPPVNQTSERPIDAITLRLDGQVYPTDQRNADGEIVITRDSARAFLQEDLKDERALADTPGGVGNEREDPGGQSRTSSLEKTAKASASPYEGNKLENGTSPYDAYFGQGHYSRRDNNKIVFKNGQSFDAVVCLVEAYSGETIRNEYIRAGAQFEMTSIPDGRYHLKTFYGQDWNPNKRILGGRIMGGFETNFHFDESEGDVFRMRDDGYQYSAYEVTLYAVAGGNMRSQNINASEFFN